MPIGKQGDKIGVYLFAIPKKVWSIFSMCLVHSAYDRTGVETTVTAMANYLLFCRGNLDNPAVVVGRQSEAWEMVGIRNGVNGWKHNPELLFAHSLQQADWAQGPGKEILQECLAKSPTFFGWGEVEGFFSSVSQDGASPIRRSRSCRQSAACGKRERRSSPGSPAFGAALRGLREASFTVNFLRQEGAVDGGGKAFSGINAVLLGLLLIGAVAWGVSYPVKDEIRLRQLQKENQRLAPSVEALRREDTELQKARKEVSFFTNFDQRKGEVLRLRRTFQSGSDQCLSFQPALSCWKLGDPRQCRKRVCIDSRAGAFSAF